jgi:hypothetical protein
MIWTAVFLLCSQVNCVSIGSPIFKTKEVCEFAVRQYGLQAIAEAHPLHRVADWKCVSFFEVKT